MFKPCVSFSTRALFAVSAMSVATAASAADFSLISSLSTPASEIGAYDSGTDKYFVTDGANGLFTSALNSGGVLQSPVAIPFASPFLGGVGIAAVSSVAIDPLGRGFGVATVIPDLRTQTGKLVVFSTADNSIFGSFDTGFHPDSVVFSPDGSKILVANEGDWEADAVDGGYAGTNADDTPGSISIFDASAIPNNPVAIALTGSEYDFTAPNLGVGASLVGIRDFAPTTASGMNTPTSSPALGRIEPEYIAVSADGTKAFVTLQQNNAIAVFDLINNQWSDIQDQGTITQTVDASDRDGAGNTQTIAINDIVKGMPMSDTIQSFTDGNGNVFYVTVNEGDAALSDFNRAGGLGQTNGVTGNLDPTYAGSINLTNTGFSRLNVSKVDGDTDGDGDIDEIIMAGTRSMSVWDASGNLVYDTGSLFEENLRDNFPGSWQDARSDDKGPEPEALVLGVVDGELLAFVGNERTSEIVAIKLLAAGDLSFDGVEPVIVSTLFAPGLTRPESLYFIDAASSPTGYAVLLATFEGDGTNGAGIASFTVPEPSSLALLGLGGLLVARRRR